MESLCPLRAGVSPVCIFRPSTGDFQSSQTEGTTENELDRCPQLKKHCLWHQPNPQKPRTLLKLTWQEVAMGASAVPTSHQPGYPAVPARVPPWWGGGASHRHRQSAATVPLIKPTCSLVTPASWVSHPTTPVPLAGLLLLTSPCTVNTSLRFLIPCS